MRRQACDFTCLLSSLTSSILRPMKRLTEKKVFSGFTTAWRFAICKPTRSVLEAQLLKQKQEMHPEVSSLCGRCRVS